MKIGPKRVAEVLFAFNLILLTVFVLLALWGLAMLTSTNGSGAAVVEGIVYSLDTIGP